MNEATLETRTLKKDDILFRQGDTDMTVYRIESGSILMFVAKGSRIDPILNCSAGKFIGASSHFLNIPKFTHAVAMEECVITVIPAEVVASHFPPWLKNIAKSLSEKTLDNILQIANVGIRRKGETVSPLSMEEQRHIFSLIKEG